MHAQDFRTDRYGMVTGLREGGYSDDMTLAAVAGKSLLLQTPSCLRGAGECHALDFNELVVFGGRMVCNNASILRLFTQTDTQTCLQLVLKCVSRHPSLMLVLRCHRGEWAYDQLP
jgi:hypothetical protein